MKAVTESARLLVVDDEAASGAEAVRSAASSRPDLVLLDVMMPDGDGFEALQSRTPWSGDRAMRGLGWSGRRVWT